MDSAYHKPTTWVTRGGGARQFPSGPYVGHPHQQENGMKRAEKEQDISAMIVYVTAQ
jgi:hypothetical protein